MATDFEIEIDQGADFTMELVLYTDEADVMDLTDATVEARLADGPGGTHLLTFTSLVVSPEADGTITVSATASQTDDLDFYRGFWNLEITQAGAVTRLVEGVAKLKRKAT